MIHRIILVLFAVQQVTGREITKMEHLAKDILKDIDPIVLPETDLPMTLKAKMSLLCVINDAGQQAIIAKFLEKYLWTDTRMKWNPNEYGGIKEVHVPAYKIWTPDITVFDSGNEMIEREDINVIIANTGRLAWFPTATYRLRCGRKSCELNLGSGTLHNRLLKMNQDGILDTKMYGESCPIKISNPTIEVVTHVYPGCEDPKWTGLRYAFCYQFSLLRMNMTISGATNAINP